MAATSTSRVLLWGGQRAWTAPAQDGQHQEDLLRRRDLATASSARQTGAQESFRQRELRRRDPLVPAAVQPANEALQALGVPRGRRSLRGLPDPLAPEGHIGFCLGNGPNAKYLQSHLATSCVTGEPGLNNDFTIAQSHDGGYYTHRIPREANWG